MSRAHFAWLALLAAAPSVARADLPIWEEHPENEEQHRYVKLTGYLQPGMLWRQEQDQNPSVDTSDTQLLIQRARFGFRVQLFRWMQWRVEMETTPTPTLTDAYVDLLAHPAFNVRVGQFQLPFLRTFQFDEANLAFIDRLVYTPQNPERTAIRVLSPRDIGLMFTGVVGNADPNVNAVAFQYWAGVFLGRGANQIINDDGVYLWSARAVLHVFGMPKGQLAESDLAYNEQPRLAIGVGGYTNCSDRNNWDRGFTGDIELRYRGLFAYTTFLWMRSGGAGNDAAASLLGYGGATGFCRDGYNNDPTHDPKFDYISWGTSVQAQYILPTSLIPLPTMAFEVLARFDYVAPNNPYDGTFFGYPGAPVGTMPPANVAYSYPGSYREADNPPSRYRVTVGLNWFPTHQQLIRLSVNYQINLEAEAVNSSGVFYNAVHNDIFWLQATVGI